MPVRTEVVSIVHSRWQTVHFSKCFIWNIYMCTKLANIPCCLF